MSEEVVSTEDVLSEELSTEDILSEEISSDEIIVVDPDAPTLDGEKLPNETLEIIQDAYDFFTDKVTQIGINGIVDFVTIIIAILICFKKIKTTVDGAITALGGTNQSTITQNNTIQKLVDNFKEQTEVHKQNLIEQRNQFQEQMKTQVEQFRTEIDTTVEEWKQNYQQQKEYYENVLEQEKQRWTEEKELLLQEINKIDSIANNMQLLNNLPYALSVLANGLPNTVENGTAKRVADTLGVNGDNIAVAQGVAKKIDK